MCVLCARPSKLERSKWNWTDIKAAKSEHRFRATEKIPMENWTATKSSDRQSNERNQMNVLNKLFSVIRWSPFTFSLTRNLCTLHSFRRSIQSDSLQLFLFYTFWQQNIIFFLFVSFRLWFVCGVSLIELNRQIGWEN